jgi:phage tail-like protein
VPTQSRHDPYGQFNFLVEIDNVPAAGFSKCSGLSTETDVIEYREGSDLKSVRKIPGVNRYSAITLERGITTDKSLWQWRKNVMDGNLDRRNGSIVLLDEARNEVARWNFTNGWPSRWDGPSFNAKSSEIAIETLEIVHEGLDWA